MKADDRTSASGQQDDSDVEADSPEGDLGKIQSILFGSQARQFDEKLAGLETTLRADLGAMEAGLRADMAAMEKRLKASFDASVADLTAALAAEYDGRSAAMKAAAAQHKTDKAELTKAVAAAEKAAEKANQATEKLLTKRSDELHKAVETTRAALERQLSEAQSGLADAKVDRTSLAAMLEQTAAALRSDEAKGSPAT